ncbi:MAG: 4Fe-4S dicluster domain-containing protein [Candidatus Hodarchaeales archaeon]|jgi:heterodisulfide reductase subunit C
MSELLQDFKDLYEVMKLCYQCGACAGKCPIFRHSSNFNPRRIMKKLLLGEFNRQTLVEQQIWYCRTCSLCSTRCPQGINVGYVIKGLKNIMTKVDNVQVRSRVIKEIQ